VATLNKGDNDIYIYVYIIIIIIKQRHETT